MDRSCYGRGERGVRERRKSEDVRMRGEKKKEKKKRERERERLSTCLYEALDCKFSILALFTLTANNLSFTFVNSFSCLSNDLSMLKMPPFDDFNACAVGAPQVTMSRTTISSFILSSDELP